MKKVALKLDHYNKTNRNIIILYFNFNFQNNSKKMY